MIDIYIIDENTGRSISTGDIHFDDQQSTGLYYQKRLFFLSPENMLRVSIPSDSIFFIYNIKGGSDQKLILSDIISREMLIEGKHLDDDSNLYLYYINLGCKSDVPGEFHDELTLSPINDPEDSYIKLNIISSFYGQREEYEILLNNQGIQLPHDIIRSFYDTDVHNHVVDWVFLNKKYKELLLNIMDIVYKKGSYKSLITNLDWFEYGDCINLYEYWTDPQQRMLHRRDITREYTGALKQIMSMYRKTTFISVSLPTKKVGEYLADEDGIKTYPITEDLQLKWSRDDLALKMTLLGNFFSTFFAPIHIDLIYSNIEDIVYTSLRYISGADMTTYDSFIHNSDMLTAKYEDEIVAEDVSSENYTGLCAKLPVELTLKNVVGKECGSYNKIIYNYNDGTKVYKELPVELNSDNNIYNIELELHGGLENGVIYVNIVSDTGYTIGTVLHVKVYYQDTNFETQLLIPLEATDMYNNIWGESKGTYKNTDFLSWYTSEVHDNNYIYINEKNRNYISAIFVSDENLDREYNLSLYIWNETNSSYSLKLLIPTPTSTSATMKDITISRNSGIYDITTDKGQTSLAKLIYINTYYTLYVKRIEDSKSGRYGYMLYIIRPLDINDMICIRRSGDIPKLQFESKADGKVYEGKSIYFNEYRFIPSLWKPSGKNLANIPTDDAILRFVPNQHYIDGAYWKITNRTTRESNNIYNYISPTFWGNGKISTRGYYDVTLVINKEGGKTAEIVHDFEFNLI